MTFSKKPRMPQPGIVACLIVAIALLMSVIGCGVARFDLATANEAAETALSVSADAEQADAVADALPSAHKTFDALAQHHRTLPHRMRSLTPSRWWHHTQAWPTARQHLDTGYAAAADICPSGRMLLTQFCISQR